MMANKIFNITMTDGNKQSIVASYYSCDDAQYVFWKQGLPPLYEVSEVYRVPMMLVKSLGSTVEET